MLEDVNKMLNKLFDKDVNEYERVHDAISRIDEIDDEWEEVYNSSSKLGKQIMDQCAYDFADDAIGESFWRNGTDFED